MYCKICGSELNPEAKFCKKCGQPLHNLFEGVKHQKNEPINHKESKSAKYSTIVVITIVIAVFIIAFSVLINSALLTSRNQSEVTNSASQSKHQEKVNTNAHYHGITNNTKKKANNLQENKTNLLGTIILKKGDNTPTNYEITVDGKKAQLDRLIKLDIGKHKVIAIDTRIGIYSRLPIIKEFNIERGEQKEISLDWENGQLVHYKLPEGYKFNHSGSFNLKSPKNNTMIGHYRVAGKLKYRFVLFKGREPKFKGEIEITFQNQKKLYEQNYKNNFESYFYYENGEEINTRSTSGMVEFNEYLSFTLSPASGLYIVQTKWYP